MEQKRLIGNIEREAQNLVDTLRRKNSDYGNSFSELFSEIGMPYAYIHMAEKLNRIKSIMDSHGTHSVSESMEDSIRDLAGYAILTLAHINDDESEPAA